jgi:protein TonB
MFRDSLLEDCTDRGGRRRFATVVSFALQSVVACVFIVLPLLYPEVLPLMHASSSLLMPAPASGAPHPRTTERVRHSETAPVVAHDPVIHKPHSIPRHTDTSPDAGETIGFRIPGAVSDVEPVTNLPIMTQLTRPPLIHPSVKPASATKVRVSPGVSQGLLITRVEPKYPELPRRIGIQGDVILAAIIGRDGRIENLHVVSGHPMLAPAAVDAVKQWRYQPYMLGSQPVEVETQITVRFTLASE